ncbi:hypothetical protein M3664_22780 [Paenibacillus lautus]|uniref:hypothetical protein n=1 Tax=Paenibacillus lautus TaxID=1401 RepID=UPI00203BABA1|nr:hypothetical protein [Paenibacillus lautus]MCM3260621.1 hypothetical protein [Paenibacillus lautus]
MNIEELKATLSGSTTEEKTEILSHFCDIFESYNNSIENFNDIVTVLLHFGIKEESLDMKEEIFSTVLSAATYKNVEWINFDILADNLERLPEECLHSALTILSFTFKKEYLPYLSKYLAHKNSSIRAGAINAINEIEGYWSKRKN